MRLEFLFGKESSFGDPKSKGRDTRFEPARPVRVRIRQKSRGQTVAPWTNQKARLSCGKSWEDSGHCLKE